MTNKPGLAGLAQVGEYGRCVNRVTVVYKAMQRDSGASFNHATAHVREELYAVLGPCVSV